LMLVDAPDTEHQLAPDERQQVGRTFVTAMRDYLDDRPGHATLRIEGDE